MVLRGGQHGWIPKLAVHIIPRLKAPIMGERSQAHYLLSLITIWIDG